MIPTKNKPKKNFAVAEQWLICSIDGIVVSGTENFVVGGYAADYLAPSVTTDFEDLLAAVKDGIDVHAVLPSRMGKVKLESDTLFSSPVLRMTFFYNDTDAVFGDRGRLVSGFVEYMNPQTSKALEVLHNLSEESELSETVRGKIFDAINSIESLSQNGRFIAEHYNNDDSFETAYDISELFDMINSRVGGALPFSATFENYAGNDHVICTSNPGETVGIIMMSAAIAAELSSKNKCHVSLSADGDSLMLTVESSLRKTVKMRCFGCEISKLCEITPSSFGEITVLESLILSSGWNAEFSIDSKRNFSLRLTLEREKNSDRLKFFDSLAEVPQSIDKYTDFINKNSTDT